MRELVSHRSGLLNTPEGFRLRGDRGRRAGRGTAGPRRSRTGSPESVRLPRFVIGALIGELVRRGHGQVPPGGLRGAHPRTARTRPVHGPCRRRWRSAGNGPGHAPTPSSWAPGRRTTGWCPSCCRSPSTHTGSRDGPGGLRNHPKVKAMGRPRPAASARHAASRGCTRRRSAAWAAGPRCWRGDRGRVRAAPHPGDDRVTPVADHFGWASNGNTRSARRLRALRRGGRPGLGG